MCKNVNGQMTAMGLCCSSVAALLQLLQRKATYVCTNLTCPMHIQRASYTQKDKLRYTLGEELILCKKKKSGLSDDKQVAG
jgi:hypothetical protein